MTIDQLVQAYDPQRHQLTVSHEVVVPNFSTFYARYGRYPIGKELKEDVFVIASVVAVIPNTGAFTRFLRSINHRFSYIAVESVLNKRLADFLLREGFTFTSPNVFWRQRNP